MNIQNNAVAVNFGVQMPKKQTYNSMKKYYASIGDSQNAKAYQVLENRAKARLHDKKSAVAQQKLLDLSEEIGEEPMNIKEFAKYAITQVKNSFIAIKEAILGAFYASRV